MRREAHKPRHPVFAVHTELCTLARHTSVLSPNGAKPRPLRAPPRPLPFVIARSSPPPQVVLVGIFHRCFSNAAILHDVLQHLGAPGSTETTSSTSSSTPASSSGPLAGVDAIAVEARHSFLPTYARIARGMPRALLRRLQHVPLGDLRVGRGGEGR